LKVIVLFTLAILFLFVVVQWRAAEREAQAERAFPAHGEILDVNGVEVHALVMGDGPDLILIHGASGNVRDMTFDGFAETLAETYRVIIFDRPALGHTGHVAPEYGRIAPRLAENPFHQAALLQGAAAQLGAERPILLGQSFGGAVAWAWALTQPDIAGVVSVAGVANPWPGKLSAIHRVNASIAGSAVVVPMITAFASETAIDRTLKAIFAPQSVPAGYKEHVGVGLTLRRKTMRGNARQVTSVRPHIVDISRRYGEIKVPVEIVHGDADPIVPLDVHSASLPTQIEGAQMIVVPNGGHMLHHTHRDQVISAIQRVAERAGLR
jgi:pimeloyl-ACP methyl ester carboxylesterase